MFFDENPRSQNLDRIVLVNRHFMLYNYRSAVQRLVNEMNRASARLRSLIQRLLLRFKSGEQRQQAGMNIQNASAKTFDEFMRKNAHVSGEANQIDIPRAQLRDDFAIVFFSCSTAPCDY